MIPLYDGLGRKAAEELVLVLAASGIGCMIREGADGYEVMVEEEEADRAAAAVRAYWRENPREPRPSSLPPLEKSWSGVVVALVLLVVYLRTGALDSSQETVRYFAAHASRISSAGEIYRCVTALFLHGGWPHLLGNMAGIAIFATGVIQVSGDGVGWLMILLTAAVANWVNASLFAVMGHISFGASTAVFAAAGILSAYNTVRRYKEGQPLLKVLLPLGAGAAILSFAGTGPGSDITGHLLGFVMGTGGGALYGFYGWRASSRGQLVCLLFSALICALSFWMGRV